VKTYLLRLSRVDFNSIDVVFGKLRSITIINAIPDILWPLGKKKFLSVFFEIEIELNWIEFLLFNIIALIHTSWVSIFMKTIFLRAPCCDFISSSFYFIFSVYYYHINVS
jgi:hypothetical protein